MRSSANSKSGGMRFQQIYRGRNTAANQIRWAHLLLIKLWPMGLSWGGVPERAIPAANALDLSGPVIIRP
jgi:hypothetical protein